MADSTPQIDISWVQCNRCMKKLIKHETLRYGLTNCGHIYCENCLKNATQPKCFVCQMPNPRSVVLDRHLRPELRAQFIAILPMSQTMRVAIKYRDHHDTVNSQRFKKGLAGIGLQFRYTNFHFIRHELCRKCPFSDQTIIYLLSTIRSTNYFFN